MTLPTLHRQFFRLCILGMIGTFAATAGEPAAIGDPMRPSSLASDSSADQPRRVSYRVQSIVVSPERRVAVINGRSLEEGEALGAARVVAIEAYEVIIEVDGQRRRLGLTDTRIKTQAEQR
ncbi:MAG: hypothetical protein R3217_07710 [Gammaproteobacteria bacterium]|nr:hypothetical protein [Gammaproteobacteria bacterium]